MLHSLCDRWEFTPVWSDDFKNGEGSGEAVRLPHTVKVLPLHQIDHRDYQLLCGYRRCLEIGENLKGKRLFLQFDGAAHVATVYINGREIMTHRTGYTAFRFEITDLVRYGENNLLSLRLDTTENPQIPPFGFVIDYLTYGGLYREVWLDVREPAMISDIYITTPAADAAKVQLTLEGADHWRIDLLDEEGKTVLTKTGSGQEAELSFPGARRWDVKDPCRYTCRVTLLDNGTQADVQEVKFGFRTAQFRADGFYLNGKKVFLQGLNRHQSWPYVGYAVPERLQREDARILKEELGCNAVRTSHYPQSHHFIDECDRLGLLVFTEIPGWQHVGDESWQEQACENVKEMVLQYRNHPSIILWGVRINESLDFDDFYRKTNAIAHELDPGRATSGVRYLTKSHLLEDVYAFNDFSHVGTNHGARPKREVTPDQSKAMLISECNGHMYPTKPFDTWQRRQEHALRHARVQDAALSSGEHAGCFGWCMFDYATHKDFGSGDRICYHGVMDSFRNPKLAAALYASQSDEKPVLEIGSTMDIGDYPGGQVGLVYAFTNADEVELYKNGNFVAKLSPSPWKGLHHGPLVMDDTIGCLLETQEGFDRKKAALLRRCLLSAGKHGLSGMPLFDMLSMGYAMVRYGLKFSDGVDLYGKYVGNWGGESTVWRFDAKVGGRVVASVTRCPGSKLHLEAAASHTALVEGDTYDMAAVRIRILDEYGNTVPYVQLPVKLTLTENAELVGPDVVTAEGGMCGTYIRTLGKPGKAYLTVETDQTEPVTVEFTIQ